MSNSTGTSSLPSFGTVEPCIQEAFEVQGKLAEGYFWRVWRCQRRSTKQLFAVKSMDISRIRDVARYERDLKVLESLSSPYLVSLHEVFRGDSQLHLVMDLCAGGNLMKYLAGYWSDPIRAHVRKANPDVAIGLPSGQVLRCMWQMLAGIAYLHHHGCVHRDIKLANFMLMDSSDSTILQLGDFGLCTTFCKGEPLNFCCGTTVYMAPEVLRGSYTEKCDVWSMGIAAYFLCNERHPWSSNSFPEITESILANRLEPWPAAGQVPRDLAALIDRLLTHDHHNRPSANDVLCSSKLLKKHSGLTNIDQTCCAIC